ncbi:hypothetical protein BD413DRAFT_137431 [Trametes elegans]|nr:hypothetical protein BD413DRAFT_137431 [Trametes elegans]
MHPHPGRRGSSTSHIGSSRRTSVPCTTYPHNSMYHQISRDESIECYRSCFSKSWMMPTHRRDRAAAMPNHDARSAMGWGPESTPGGGPAKCLVEHMLPWARASWNARYALWSSWSECIRPGRIFRIFPLMRSYGCLKGQMWVHDAGRPSQRLCP